MKHTTPPKKLKVQTKYSNSWQAQSANSSETSKTICGIQTIQRQSSQEKSCLKGLFEKKQKYCTLYTSTTSSLWQRRLWKSQKTPPLSLWICNGSMTLDIDYSHPSCEYHFIIYFHNHSLSKKIQASFWEKTLLTSKTSSPGVWFPMLPRSMLAIMRSIAVGSNAKRPWRPSSKSCTWAFDVSKTVVNSKQMVLEAKIT